MNEVETLLQQIRTRHETTRELLKTCPRNIHELLMAQYTQLKIDSKELQNSVGRERAHQIAHEIYLEVYKSLLHLAIPQLEQQNHNSAFDFPDHSL